MAVEAHDKVDKPSADIERRALYLRQLILTCYVSHCSIVGSDLVFHGLRQQYGNVVYISVHCVQQLSRCALVCCLKYLIMVVPVS